MNLLIKDRATEKTTGLIYTSEATQYPIVTFNRHFIKHIKHMAVEMGCLIPDPLCVEDFKEAMVRGRRLPQNILLDEAGDILGDALNAYLGTNVIAATITDSLKEKYNRMQKTKENISFDQGVR